MASGRLVDASRQLFDPTSHLIRSFASGDHPFKVDGNELAAGVYILRMESEGNVESIKLVKW